MNKIRTIKDLYEFVIKIDGQKKGPVNYSVEEYLRALWTAVNKYRFESVNGDLLAQVITEAFEVEPSEFNEQWFEYNYAYSSWEMDNDGYLLPYRYDLVTGTTYNIKRRLSNFELLRDVMLFQIADLRRMIDALPVKTTFSYQSPTGTIWGIIPIPSVTYYLSGGISQMYENDPAGVLVECSWVELALILEFARMASD